MPEDETINVRYMVDDVADSIAFSTSNFEILLEDPSGNLVELFQPAAR